MSTTIEAPTQPIEAAETEQPIGSFVRIPDVQTESFGQTRTASISVIGRKGTEFEGVRGIARSVEMGTQCGEESTRLTSRMESIARLPASHFVGIIEYGIEGHQAFLIEQTDGLTRLDQIASEQGRFPLAVVGSIVTDVARALSLSARLGVSHGDLNLFSVAKHDGGSFKVGRFPILMPDEPHSDTRQLAEFAIHLTLGRMWSTEPLLEGRIDIAVERLRGQTDGINLRVAEALAKGVRTIDEPTFGSPLEFAQALKESIQASAIDIAAGAWEAISRRDMGMANLLTEMAESYDPENPEVTLLRLRLQGDALRSPGITTGAIWDAAHHLPQPELERYAHSTEEIAPRVASISVEPLIEETGGTPLTPEIEKLLAGPPQKAAKQGKLNTWALFGIGVLLMVLVFLVISALTFTQIT